MNSINMKNNKCHVRFGQGKILIGLYVQGKDGVVHFHENGETYSIGETVKHERSETGVYISFENIESLEVLIDNLNRLAEAMRAKESPFIEAC